MAEFLRVGGGEDEREIAVRHRPGAEPTVVWFGGFRSDMTATKASALDAWAADAGRSFLRFDYSGHGASGGAFRDGTISRWLEDGLAVLDAHGGPAPVLVGSSMGGWLATLAALRRPVGALVLIAPALDFTEALMWDSFDAADRDTLMRDGALLRPSAYADEPTPITMDLIADGRRHLLLGGPIDLHCPVHILQGMADPDVPWSHAMRCLEHLPAADVQLTLVKDGDHRLSRPEDLALLLRAVDGIGRPGGSHRDPS